MYALFRLISHVSGRPNGSAGQHQCPDTDPDGQDNVAK